MFKQITSSLVGNPGLLISGKFRPSGTVPDGSTKASRQVELCDGSDPGRTDKTRLRLYKTSLVKELMEAEAGGSGRK